MVACRIAVKGIASEILHNLAFDDKITLKNGFFNNHLSNLVIDMKSRITAGPEKEYILVEPRAGDFWEICECLAREFKVPEYPEKNAIWAFPDVPIELIYDELDKIREILCKNYPKEAKPDRKVAIVVQTGLHTALASEYIRIVEDLPIKFQVFSDLPSAEAWII